MRIYVYPADMDGCGMYRMVWPAWALKKQGHDVRVVLPHERDKNLAAIADDGYNISDVYVPEDADVIVLQRISHRRLVESIPIIRSRGIAVVIDIDDDLSSIHPNNPAFTMLHPKNIQHAEHSWLQVQRACEAATLVAVSTPALQGIYGRAGNSRVLSNCVPQRYTELPHYDSDVFGWGGSLHSHVNDLAVLGNSVMRLTRDGFDFRVVGPGDGIQKELKLDNEPDITGVIDLTTAWPETLGSLGVGIAPLADTRFNKSKSWLKPLEMAAVGVPSVVSPRAEYRRLNRDGIGILADKPQQWYGKIKELLENNSMREELSARGREIVREKYTLEANAWRWLEVWAEAYEIDKGKRETPKVIASPFIRAPKLSPEQILQKRQKERLSQVRRATNDSGW